jgi:hypothetical protein
MGNTEYGILQNGHLVLKTGHVKRQNRDNLLHLIWNADSVYYSRSYDIQSDKFSKLKLVKYAFQHHQVHSEHVRA